MAIRTEGNVPLGSCGCGLRQFSYSWGAAAPTKLSLLNLQSIMKQYGYRYETAKMPVLRVKGRVREVEGLFQGCKVGGLGGNQMFGLSSSMHKKPNLYLVTSHGL